MKCKDKREEDNAEAWSDRFMILFGVILGGIIICSIATPFLIVAALLKSLFGG